MHKKKRKKKDKLFALSWQWIWQPKSCNYFACWSIQVNLFLILERVWDTILTKNIPFCKLRIFRSACRFGNLFRFKYSLERKILSGIAYCNTCSKYKFIHYGKTFGHFFTRACEHTWHWIWQKNLLKTLKIWHHLTTCCNLTPLQILANLIFQRPMKLLIKESLLIKRDKSVLNRKIKSVPLHFWNRNLGFTFP